MEGRAVGVTIVTSSYAALEEESVTRFRKYSGLDVVVIRVDDDAGFAAKLNLDRFVAPQPIVFFDVDLWLLRPYDFAKHATSGRWCAAMCPGALNPIAFPHADSVANGWEKATYFNSGLFACDLSQPNIQKVFSDARARLAACHAKECAEPVDWTDQYYLNWGVHQQAGLFFELPFAVNFYKLAVDWGSYPHIPREIIGLHAAGVPAAAKLETLRQQAAVFGAPTSPMHQEALQHFHTRQNS
jgi:hypothetical protein